jgi:thiol-disulfide isomerase/thioredoxin
MFPIRLRPKARRNLIVAALTISIALAFTSCGCSGLSCQTASPDTVSGKRAATSQAVERVPDFKVKEIGGREISSATLKGKVAIIDFWATWCPPCRKEIPHFNRLYEKYRDQGLVIVGLALDEDEAAVRRFNQQLPIRYPVALASKEVQQLFGGIEVYPTAFLVSREGEVIKKYLGYTYPDELERDVSALINNGKLR